MRTDTNRCVSPSKHLFLFGRGPARFRDGGVGHGLLRRALRLRPVEFRRRRGDVIRVGARLRRAGPSLAGTTLDSHVILKRKYFW